jgi:hypothetical protein
MAARNALLEGKGKNKEILVAYIAAAAALRDDVEKMAKRLSRPSSRELGGPPPRS